MAYIILSLPLRLVIGGTTVRVYTAGSCTS
jgi:hypothetical protein